MAENSLTKELSKFTGKYSGQGINHEGDEFKGVLTIAPIVQSKGFELSFLATGGSGEIFHEEKTILSPSIDEKMKLWNFNSNVPGMVVHELDAFEIKDGFKVATFTFGNVESTSEFREQITLKLHNDGDVSYTYSWGLPGGEYKERSGLRMSPKANSPNIDLNHIHIAVKDLEKSKEFYSKYLGFRERCYHGKCLFMTNDQGFDLALDPEYQPEPLPSWFHIGVKVESKASIDSFYNKFESASEYVSRPIERYDEFIFFHAVDPDGYKIECYWE